MNRTWMNTCELCGAFAPCTETHWRLYHNTSSAWAVCAACVEPSKMQDKSSVFKHSGFLYLPIVQPVVGSFEAICVEFILTRFCEIVWGALHEEQMRAIGAEVAA